VAVLYRRQPGVSTPNFKKSKKKLRDEFGISGDKKIILFVGSGFKRKGGYEFLKILSLVEGDFVAFMIGKEKRVNFYKNLAKNLMIDKKLFFTGARSDVEDFYSAGDILLLPTHYEPFSNVVLEAMSFKNAVFTSSQNGAHEILNSSFVMQTPQDFSIVPKIEELLNDSKKLEAIKEENYKIVQNFTIEKNAKQTLDIINKYLK